MNRTIAHILNIFLLAALIIGSAMVWDNLPERIPAHMNLSGVVDRWENRTFWSWFALPMVAVALMVILYSCARLIVRRPALINLPNKKEFLELSPRQQGPIIQLVRSFLYWIGVSTATTLLMVQYGMYRAAFGAYSDMYGVIGGLMLVVMGPLLSLVIIIKVQARIDAEKRKMASAKV